MDLCMKLHQSFARLETQHRPKNVQIGGVVCIFGRSRRQARFLALCFGACCRQPYFESGYTFSSYRDRRSCSRRSCRSCFNSARRSRSRSSSHPNSSQPSIPRGCASEHSYCFNCRPRRSFTAFRPFLVNNDWSKKNLYKM